MSVPTWRLSLAHQLRDATKLSNEAFHQTFEKICDVQDEEIDSSKRNSSARCYASAFRLPANAYKNRYSDIYPFDYNRVRITTPGYPDYINASYVTFPLNEKEEKALHIATQGPLDRTVEDFWVMVWEQKSNLIVCLTQMMEGNRMKYDPYWIENGSLVIDLPHEASLQVKHVATEQFTATSSPATHTFLNQYHAHLRAKYESFSPHFAYISNLEAVTMRKFEVRFNGENVRYHREVWQVCTAAWPDHGVLSETHFISLMELCKYLNKEEGPMVVHCSAGCGRTGSFIAVDHIMRYLEQPAPNSVIEKSDDMVFQVVTHLRRQRVAMVQTLSQYKLVHRVCASYVSDVYGWVP